MEMLLTASMGQMRSQGKRGLLDQCLNEYIGLSEVVQVEEERAARATELETYS